MLMYMMLFTVNMDCLKDNISSFLNIFVFSISAEAKEDNDKKVPTQPPSDSLDVSRQTLTCSK